MRRGNNKTTENFHSGDERKKVAERDNRVFYAVNSVNNALEAQVTETDAELSAQEAPVEIIRHTKIYDDIHEHPLAGDYSAEKHQSDAREEVNSIFGEQQNGQPTV